MSVFMKDQVTPHERVADSRSGIPMFYPPYNRPELLKSLDELVRVSDEVLAKVRFKP